MARIFLSSTFVEMEEYRLAAAAAIDQYGHQCVRMETFPASERGIPEFCRARVAECDLFVLVLGQFYGTPIPGRDISYTEDEFDAAVAVGKARLVFVPAETADTNIRAALASMKKNGLIYEEQEKRQERFRAKALAGILPRTFKDPEDLKFQIGHSVDQQFKAREIPRQKEPWINVPNTHKQILARDGEARKLIEALTGDGPAIVSITAPPGFGKSSVFAVAVRIAREELMWLEGIAVLDASVGKAGFVEFAGLVGRMSGSPPDTAFFDLLGKTGKVWLVVENAQDVLASGEFREVLKEWCLHEHEAKLLLLTRQALHPAPACHRALREVEKALLGGLLDADAVLLLRERLEDTRFRGTGETLLRRVAQRLHLVPMAIEQFAAYFRLNEEGVELDQRFVEQNDLLRLETSQQLVRMVEENLRLLDDSSLYLVRVVAWAGMPVPQSGIVALQPDGAERLTRLVRSNLLLAREGTAAEGRSYDMHPLIREAIGEGWGDGAELEGIGRVFLRAGNAEFGRGQFRPALSLYTLAEQAAGCRGGERAELARATLGRSCALGSLGELEESVAASAESIGILRELVEGEGRPELRNDLAASLVNRGHALQVLSRLEEAIASFDESIGIRRELVEQEGKQELRNGLAMAILNRCVALRKVGRLEQALVGYKEAIAIYRVLVEREGRRELRNDLAMAILGMGIALRNARRLEEALAAYDEAIVICRSLVEQEGRRESRNDLGKAVMGRGTALMDLDRLEEAAAAYDESIGIYRAMTDHEGRREVRDDLALALYNLALVLEKQGLSTALEAARDARRLWQEMVSEGMNHLRQRLDSAKELEARLS